MTKQNRPTLFERLQTGLKEGIAHAKGQLTLKTVEVPDAPPEIDSKTLLKLREQAGMSQAVFAKVLYVSLKSVQSWEQGTREPSTSSRRLIHIFMKKPEVVCEVVGLKARPLRGFKIVESKGKRRIVRGDNHATKKLATV